MSDRYRLIRTLGKGGMAEVFLAVAVGAEGFEKPVALKRALPQLSSDPAAARMFVGEARLAMHLHHQNVVAVTDVGRDRDGLYVVMELVNGWDFGVILDRARGAAAIFPEALALFVAHEVNAGLDHALRQRHQGQPLLTAHRDISPGNILISVEGEVKLADFGIAKAASAGATEPGTFRGKVAYASPETVWGKPASALSDQFSLGVVLHEALTGKMPFGEHANLALYAQALQANGPPPLEGVSPPVADLVRRMLAFDPSARFATHDELATALGDLLAPHGSRGTARELARFVASIALPPAPLALGLAPDRSVTPLALSFESSSAPMEPWEPTGPVMDESGRVEQAPAISPAQAVRPVPLASPKAEEPLELDLPTRPSVAEPALDPPPAQTARAAFRFGRGGVALILLGLLMGASWYALTHQRAVELALDRMGVAHPALPKGELPVLRIESEPEGATIRVSDEVIGQTPLVRENDFPDGEVRFTLTRKGYQAWAGSFFGGTRTTVEAKLRR